MQESCHLVAIDKPFSQRFPLFIVRLSILNHSHPLWCLECKPKNGSYHYTFALKPFLFFSFFFSKCEALDHLFCGHHLHHDHLLASPLGLDHLIQVKVVLSFPCGVVEMASDRTEVTVVPSVLMRSVRHACSCQGWQSLRDLVPSRLS